MKLTDKLISLRRESGLTQTELAEKLTVSRQTVSNWELGEAIPSADNLGRLGALYGVSMDYLMNDGAERPTAAVAVMEKPEPETPRRKPVLIGIAIGLAIAAVIALLIASFSIGYKKGVKDATPTYPVYEDVVDEADIEEPAELFGW